MSVDDPGVKGEETDLDSDVGMVLKSGAEMVQSEVKRWSSIQRRGDVGVGCCDCRFRCVGVDGLGFRG